MKSFAGGWETNEKDVANATISCVTYPEYCPNLDQDCLEATHENVDEPGQYVVFDDLEDFTEDCIDFCEDREFVHGSIIFNTFVFCQIFNEYTSKSLGSHWDVFSTIPDNPYFVAVSVMTILLQIMLIEIGGEFLETSPLNGMQWLITIGLGFISIPVGIFMRAIPVEEDEESFFDQNTGQSDGSPTKQVAVDRLSSPEMNDGYTKVIDDDKL